jgi:peroxiredoxin
MRSYGKTCLFGAAAAALILALGACSDGGFVKVADKGNDKDTKDRKMAPDFTLADHTGKRLQLSGLKGKVVLLNFWATWCGPCKVEIPWFIEFQQTYKDRDFVVLGVAMDDDGWTSVKPYMDDKKINYRIVVGNEDVAKLYGGVEAMPYTVMIDKSGRIAFKHTGLDSKSNYKKEIEQLLGDVKAANTDASANLAMRWAGGAGGALLRAN